MMKPTYPHCEESAGSDAGGGDIGTVATLRDADILFTVMDESWLKLYRRIQDHDIWQMKPEYLKIWLYLIMNANIEPRQRNAKGVTVTVKRGDVLTSIDRIALDCRVSKTTVRSCLQWCSSNGLILSNNTPRVTHLTICKYNDLQETRGGKLADNWQKAGGFLHNNKNKEERSKNKEEEESKSMRSRAFTPPDFDAVVEFFYEQGKADLAQPYFDYYTSNGWRVGKNPMKNWQAAARTWMRNESKYPQKGQNNAGSSQKRTLGHRVLEFDRQQYFNELNEFVQASNDRASNLSMVSPHLLVSGQHQGLPSPQAPSAGNQGRAVSNGLPAGPSTESDAVDKTR